jgi:hypothetical protein
MGFGGLPKKAGSPAPKSTPSEPKRQASKSPPQPPPQRPNTGGSSSRMPISGIMNTPSPPDMRIARMLNTPTPPGQIRQAARVRLPGNVWYCCACLILRKSNPPVAHEMSKDRCGYEGGVAGLPCKHIQSKCKNRTCLIQPSEEEPPMWCLGLKTGLRIPPWAAKPLTAWSSYRPFKLAIQTLGNDRWPDWWCCRCHSTKVQNRRSCQYNYLKLGSTRHCGHSVCGSCSPDGPVPGELLGEEKDKPPHLPPKGKDREKDKGQDKRKDKGKGKQKQIDEPQVIYRY